MSNGEYNPKKQSAEARVGQVLRDKYHLDGLIGVGGMAAVYSATHRNSGRFAIKLLHPMLSVDAKIRKRFLREGYVANTVSHPGAVSLIDDDVTDDGSVFLVMELLDGASVDTLWERAGFSLDPRVVMSIAHGLLEVLAVAHEKGIVHRDVKPGNVFVTREGMVKLLDFGIARLRDASSSAATLTGTGTMMGTPAFMAPEQVMGKASAIDWRTDVFAAGAVMFSLLSGQYVQEGESANELMVYAATRPARSLESVAPQVPSAIVQLVDKALAFDKARRWQSATQMRDAISQTYSELFGGDVLTAGALAQAVFGAYGGPEAIPGPSECSPPAASANPERLPVILTPGNNPASHRGGTLPCSPAEQRLKLSGQDTVQAASTSNVPAASQLTGLASRWPPTTKARKISSPVLIAGGSAGLLLAVGIGAVLMITSAKSPVVSEPPAVALTAPSAAWQAPPAVPPPDVSATARGAIVAPATTGSIYASPVKPAFALTPAATEAAIAAQQKTIAKPALRVAKPPPARASDDPNPLGHQ